MNNNNRKIVFTISGKMRSGKNQLSNYMSEYIAEKQYGTYIIDMFAGELKQNAYEDFSRLSKILTEIKLDLIEPLEDLDLINYLEDKLSWMDVKKDQFFENKTILTRALLQIYGTNIFCNRVDKDYWAKQVLKKCNDSKYDFTFISDLRFKNEISLLENNDNFKLIKIRVERETGIKSDHQSEIDLDDYNNWNFIVNNNNSLKTLKINAHKIVDFVLASAEISFDTFSFNNYLLEK